MAQAMSDLHLPRPTKDRVELRHALTPVPKDAFRAFSKAVISDTDKRDS